MDHRRRRRARGPASAPATPPGSCVPLRRPGPGRATSSRRGGPGRVLPRRRRRGHRHPLRSVRPARHGRPTIPTHCRSPSRAPWPSWSWQVSTGAAARRASCSSSTDRSDARRGLPGTVGYVKTHHVSYLPPRCSGVIGALARRDSARRCSAWASGSPATAGTCGCPARSATLGRRRAVRGLGRRRPGAAIALADRLGRRAAPRSRRRRTRTRGHPRTSSRSPASSGSCAAAWAIRSLIQRALREAAQHSRLDQRDPARARRRPVIARYDAVVVGAGAMGSAAGLVAGSAGPAGGAGRAVRRRAHPREQPRRPAASSATPTPIP